MAGYLYNQVKNEILLDHERNNFMQAVKIPLRDTIGLPKEQQTELKKIASQLTDDNRFPYEVDCTIHHDRYYTNTVKMSYRPL